MPTCCRSIPQHAGRRELAGPSRHRADLQKKYAEVVALLQPRGGADQERGRQGRGVIT